MSAFRHSDRLGLEPSRPTGGGAGDPTPPRDWPLPRDCPNVVSFDEVLEGRSPDPETSSAGDPEEGPPAEGEEQAD